MYSAQIPDDLAKRLADLVKRTGRSERFYVEKAIVQLLEDEEDYRLAMEAIAEGGEPIPFEEAKKKLGLSEDV